jgi:hypothetical protein
MIRPSRSMVWLVAAFALALAGCGGSASGRITAPSAGTLARWNAFAHVPGVVDLSNRRHDGTISVAAAGRLALLRRGATVQPFASGPSGYSSPAGEEPYIALSTGRKLPGAGCSFGADVLYVLRLGNAPGVTAVNETGHVRSFVSLPTRGLLNGIAFDTTGRFGMRLLATATAGTSTTVFAIDCHRRVSVLTRRAPKVEGGIAVAPPTFGRFAGDLIAPDENSGRIYAIAPDGIGRLVARSGLPRGGDVGVESAGFVPPGFGPGWSALVADRLTPGNPHPGDDVILSVSAAALTKAGARRGDLLVATEGGAHSDAISCTRTCRVTHVADGPSIAHVEGHIVFTPPR